LGGPSSLPFNSLIRPKPDSPTKTDGGIVSPNAFTVWTLMTSARRRVRPP